LLQVAVMPATDAAGKPYVVHVRLYQHPVPAQLSPPWSSLGRWVSWDGLLRADYLVRPIKLV